MPWWQTVACVLIGVTLYRLGLREWRLWREFRAASISNSSRPVTEGQKKAPDQAEAGKGVEYGGTHLP